MFFFINFVRTSPNRNIIYVTELVYEIKIWYLIFLFFHGKYYLNLDCEIYFGLAGLNYFRILNTNCHVKLLKIQLQVKVNFLGMQFCYGKEGWK